MGGVTMDHLFWTGLAVGIIIGAVLGLLITALVIAGREDAKYLGQHGALHCRPVNDNGVFKYSIGCDENTTIGQIRDWQRVNLRIADTHDYKMDAVKICEPDEVKQ
jgi:hypothetical protein